MTILKNINYKKNLKINKKISNINQISSKMLTNTMINISKINIKLKSIIFNLS